MDDFMPPPPKKKKNNLESQILLMSLAKTILAKCIQWSDTSSLARQAQTKRSANLGEIPSDPLLYEIP